MNMTTCIQLCVSQNLGLLLAVYFGLLLVVSELDFVLALCVKLH